MQEHRRIPVISDQADSSALIQALAADGDQAGRFQVDTSSRAEAGLAELGRARQSGRPYALLFIDQPDPAKQVVAQSGAIDPDLQIVLLTAGQIRLRIVVRQAVQQYDAARQIRRLNELTHRQKQELQQWNQALEKLVRHRTCELDKAYVQKFPESTWHSLEARADRTQRSDDVLAACQAMNKVAACA